MGSPHASKYDSILKSLLLLMFYKGVTRARSVFSDENEETKTFIDPSLTGRQEVYIYMF